MRKCMTEKFEKYGVVLMALALFAFVLAKPMLAHAECEHGDWSHAQHREFFDHRKKALHDELKLAPSQEAAWNEFIDKSKPGEQRPKFDRSELSSLPTPERLDRMLSMMQMRQQKMESHVQAVKSFYAQLTAEQQKIFDASFRHHRGRHEKH